ncbi:MAG: ribonuclease P protein subunit [Aigarchaeota archaeon]|nr:ribonuclease P protein subunit [Aigarchaeota archaeon]MDW8092203.1 ribonuclease P protein subunit [Nitrososphaerota archaeon]
MQGGTRRIRIPISLVGYKARVVSLDGSRVFSGTVIEETKNMIWLRTEDGKVVRLPKAGFRLIITLTEGERIGADGRYLIGRPADRVRAQKRMWIKVT